ncbi:UvrD-helicase domain-containing protein [Amorphus sp. 3PC139-8]|uniref:UvrD-helicase domain-containing protein n=1 Tax=Amorphus sp. 3PC139-8 TaxID=2735676 RepID=UPI00345DF9E5
MPPTLEQTEIREAASRLDDGDVLRVLAFAGAGKTTTLKGIAHARPDTGLYLAFNKPIANEANQKFRDTRCTARTMHSLAWRATGMTNEQSMRLNAKAVQHLIDMGRFHWPRLKRWNAYRCAAAVSRTVDIFCASADPQLTDDHAQQALVLTCGDPAMIRDPRRAGIVRNTIASLLPSIAAAAQRVWDTMVTERQFSHDAYLKILDLSPTVRNRAFAGVGYVLVDESQDLNPVQRSILVKSGLPLVAVGDPYQQIYSFRGAENALSRLPGRELYLTASFRFGEGIADQARKILASRPDGGPSQRLVGARPDGPMKRTAPRSALLARSNAELLRAGINYAKKEIKISFLGGIEEVRRDAQSAQALHDGDLEAVRSPELASFDSWDELLMEAEAGNSTMARLQKLVEEGMPQHLDRLAAYEVPPQRAQIVLSTAHKAKGCEWPQVILANDWRSLPELQERHKKATTESPAAVTAALEEWNLLYVAATRAIGRTDRLERILSPSDAAPTNRPARSCRRHSRKDADRSAAPSFETI